MKIISIIEEVYKCNINQNYYMIRLKINKNLNLGNQSISLLLNLELGLKCHNITFQFQLNQWLK